MATNMSNETQQSNLSAYIGDGGHQAEIVCESPTMVERTGCQLWSVYLPRRDGSGRYDYRGFPSRELAVRHVEAHPDFRRWVRFMKLSHPVEIAPNLEPGVRIGADSWVTISYSRRPGRDGRTRYRWTVIRNELRDETHDDIQSGIQGGDLRNGLSSLLSFLVAFAEANRPHYAERIDRENCDLFPESLADWASQHSDEIGMAATMVDENEECITEG